MTITPAASTSAPPENPIEPPPEGPASGRAWRLRAVWSRWGPPGWSLRTRLIAVLLALLAMVSLVIGVVSVVALRSYLSGQLDEDVNNAALRTRDAVQSPRGENELFRSGQPEGTVIGLVGDGRLLDPDGPGPATGPIVITTSGDTGTIEGDTSVLLSVDADTKIHTRDLGGDLGTYRLRAYPLGDSPVVAVTGLPVSDVDDTVFRLAAVVTGVTLAGLVLAAAAGAAIVRLTLRPLRRVAATARAVSEMPLARGEVALAVRVPDADSDPRTEVGQVGTAINNMLGHVGEALTARQASETRVRRFVADASHELRTPLAAIRGYAELSRRSQEPVPPDVAHAMSRVESQAVRMTGLVEDLLLLASLDSGRMLVREPVDLAPLLVDAVSDAHAAGPDHTWRLDVPADPITVIGEAARLTQVVVNLLGNARAHTPAGTTVTVGLGTEPADAGRDASVQGVTPPGHCAVILIADDGPGIPPQLLPEVFERFARGDSSRSRAAGSTGLGLAIVSAVVAAHGGTVGVESIPGRTTFTVRLPLTSSR